MAQRRALAGFLALCLIANAFCVPNGYRLRRGFGDNEVDTSHSKQSAATTAAPQTTTEKVEVSPNNDDDDDSDEEFQVTPNSSQTSGSNIFSLLNLVTSLFPGSSSSNVKIRKLLRNFILKNQASIKKIIRRIDKNSEIETNFIVGLKPPSPPFQRQESEDNDTNESVNSQNDTEESKETDNGGKEESLENDSKPAKQSSDSELASDGDDDDDDDYDEPPGGGDGQGGGVLGLLAGLSGGEDGQSDLGSLLAAVSGIVANLSGDGFDLNALIASGIGLFVGLLSEGEENPGAVIASYLLTSLDTITGGGAKNNGAFFGTFLSKLVKGSSAGGDPDASSEENGGMKMADSAGFFVSLILGLLGDMSKTSSGGSSKPW